jgi:hypothetical protein
VIVDPLARLDQVLAAFGTQATMLAEFRNKLVRQGFSRDEAAELVNIWYQQMLQVAAIARIGEDIE